MAFNFREKTEQTAVPFLVSRAFETKISPVLISRTTTNQDQASNEQKTITFTSFSRGTSALLDSLSPSLCCLHPCHRKELWKVFQLCSNSIYLPSSSGLTTLLWIRGAGGCLFLSVPVQNRRQLLFLANHREAGEFLWILWLAWNALDSHSMLPTISNHPLCLSPQYCQFSWCYRD